MSVENGIKIAAALAFAAGHTYAYYSTAEVIDPGIAESYRSLRAQQDELLAQLYQDGTLKTRATFPLSFIKTTSIANPADPRIPRALALDNEIKPLAEQIAVQAGPLRRYFADWKGMLLSGILLAGFLSRRSPLCAFQLFDAKKSSV